jgi:hypothetical protein
MPKNSAMLIIDYQPVQVNSIRVRYREGGQEGVLAASRTVPDHRLGPTHCGDRALSGDQSR